MCTHTHIHAHTCILSPTKLPDVKMALLHTGGLTITCVDQLYINKHSLNGCIIAIRKDVTATPRRVAGVVRIIFMNNFT